MAKFVVATSMFGTLAMIIFADALWASAIAHEVHHMRCTQTNINAIRADIQAMRDGEVKRIATEEMEKAEDKMARRDMEGCAAHLHNAVEAIEN